jgi:hypothetical protein
LHIGFMTKAIVGMGTKEDCWRARIAEQEQSGMSVGRFCRERGLTEASFYGWRKRLRKAEPVRFAVVERGRMPQPCATEPVLELVLNTGERLRIGVGVDAAALRTVLAALRA